MTKFQQIALLLTVTWLVAVAVRFRRSTIVLVGGLVAIGLYTVVAIAYDGVTLNELGLGTTNSWLMTLGFAVIWCGLMFAYSPVADRIATRIAIEPPNLKTFRAIQESRTKLIAGIVMAWALGGILEEMVFRGIVLKSVESLLSGWMIEPLAVAIAICVAANGASIIHLYQGPRAVIIIAQLSVLFGLLFALSGFNLWSVIFCHGLYDTIAFIRFANKKSRYSDLENDSP
jgi:membrane protease YdiL (CAAX protease family)